MRLLGHGVGEGGAELHEATHVEIGNGVLWGDVATRFRATIAG